MRLRPLALLALSATATFTAACNDNGLRDGVPAQGLLTLNVPEEDGQALRAGATSELFRLTREIATNINGSVGFVFALSEQILALPPTETDNETYAVWGPSEPRGLERNSFRFTVNKVDDSQFTYKLEARPKAATEESDFVVVWEGISFPDGADGGHGELDIHFGTLRSIDDSECNSGDMHVDYVADAQPRTIDVIFTGVANACNAEAPTNASYHYEETADGAGLLDFVFVKNTHGDDENKPLEETSAVRSRWLADGQGRSDVRISGGEIPADIAANIPDTTATSADIVECWDAGFNVVYVDTNPDELEPYLGYDEEGDAALCAFADASFAELVTE